MRLAGVALTVVLAALPGCYGGREGGTVLRLATTQSGERMKEPFRAALRAFEVAHPGVTIELVEMNDEVYQQMGLVTLFLGGTPPDVYFQWGGYQVAKYAAAGYALDLASEFPPEQRRRYYPFCWNGARGWDKNLYLWPDSASLTTVLWFRRSLFEKADVRTPGDWVGFLALCERLKGSGVIPLAVGNKELWPGGNFAAYFVAQFAGAARYNEVLGLKSGTRLDDPDFVRALELLAELQSRGYLNRGVGGVGTDDARSLLAQRKAAMHPIGDWLVSEADEGDVQDLDAFLLPHLPGQKGADGTLLALPTGYVIRKGTPHPEEAKALLRHLTSDAVQQEWARHGHVSAVRAAAPGADAPEGQRRLLRFMERAPASAIAPDVGFNPEVSDAFLDAVSLVLGERATPAGALAQAEAQVRALRR
jgi:raffinose/stachyose/melibiose transport system substrate-binding protein